LCRLLLLLTSRCGCRWLTRDFRCLLLLTSCCCGLLLLLALTIKLLWLPSWSGLRAGRRYYSWQCLSALGRALRPGSNGRRHLRLCRTHWLAGLSGGLGRSRDCRWRHAAHRRLCPPSP
jgi:hypothetical protein